MGDREQEMKMQLREAAVHDLLFTIEEDPNREGLKGTPNRVARMYEEVFKGYAENPVDILGRTFDEDYGDMVIVRDITFYSHCEHHMVPFFGRAHIGYIPNGRVVGISKLVRLVECFAHRVQIQERLTAQIADTLMDVLAPLGCYVIMEAEHMCMKMRGVKNPCADTVTSAVRGIFKEDPKARQEFLALIALGGKNK